MKALIIGGNRFFGKRLAIQLLEKNVEVTLLNRGQRDDGLGNQIERIVLDRKELKKDHPELSGRKWDIVYDQVCYDAAEAQGACDAFSGKTNRFVFTSSQSVYGPGAQLLESAFDPLIHQFTQNADRNQDYAEAKRQAETVFFRNKIFDELTAVRFPIVLGTDDYTERLKQHLDWMKQEKTIYFPNIEAEISFVQSQDAGAFLASLITKGLSGPVNVCAEKPIALKKVIQILETTTGKRAKTVHKESEGEPSPFGIESDWNMNTQKLTQYGFKAEPIENWLPALSKAL